MDPRREDGWLINGGDTKDFTSTCYKMTFNNRVDKVNTGIDILLRVLSDGNSIESTPEVGEGTVIA